MTEHDQARAWRESLGLSQKQLADRLGYSRHLVYWMERGVGAPRRVNGRQAPTKLDPWAWRRYKNACAGVAAEIRNSKVFDWE